MTISISPNDQGGLTWHCNGRDIHLDEQTMAEFIRRLKAAGEHDTADLLAKHTTTTEP